MGAGNRPVPDFLYTSAPTGTSSLMLGHGCNISAPDRLGFLLSCSSGGFCRFMCSRSTRYGIVSNRAPQVTNIGLDVLLVDVYRLDTVTAVQRGQF